MIIEKWAFATYFVLESDDSSAVVPLQDRLVVRMLTDPTINCMKIFWILALCFFKLPVLK